MSQCFRIQSARTGVRTAAFYPTHLSGRHQEHGGGSFIQFVKGQEGESDPFLGRIAQFMQRKALGFRV